MCYKSKDCRCFIPNIPGFLNKSRGTLKPIEKTKLISLPKNPS